MRIQPYSENPFYWQYKGEPVLLLGGTIASAMVRRRVMLLSLSSGAILGIALIALLPEAVELSEGIWPHGTVFVIAALGYAPLIVAAFAALIGSLALMLWRVREPRGSA